METNGSSTQSSFLMVRKPEVAPPLRVTKPESEITTKGWQQNSPCCLVDETEENSGSRASKKRGSQGLKRLRLRLPRLIHLSVLL